MKTTDAPRPGWYPDPDSRERLRWWEGTDWTDHYRAPPRESELARYAADHVSAPQQQMQTTGPTLAELQAMRRRDSEEVVGEVRKVARSEIDRAIEQVSLQARAATRQIQPLVSEYSNKILTFLKKAMFVAFILIVAWFVFQAIAQQTFFNWLGDRIDNITD